MDKYLAPKGTSSVASTKGACSDLLSMMKNSNAPKATPWSVPAKESNASNIKAVDNGWAQREATINSTTIKCNERTKSLNTDIKGWKVVDNQKVYTTFRNGKVVSASGFEGFKLASGDKPKSKQPTQDISKEQGSLGTKRKAYADGERNAENVGPNKSTARPKQLQKELKW